MATTLSARQIAYAVHETLCAYDRARGKHTVSWVDTPPAQRQAVINVATNVRANPDLDPADRHEAWREAKCAAGWRWGPVYSRPDKWHPNLMSWGELPEADRVREYLMCAMAKALLTLKHSDD